MEFDNGMARTQTQFIQGSLRPLGVSWEEVDQKFGQTLVYLKEFNY